MAVRSVFYRLPTELQTEVTKYLNPTDVNLTLSHTIDRGVIEDQIKRNAPTSLPEKLAYYERVGYQPGIYQFLPRGRLLDEGVSTLVLQEVGKRGDSKMVKFLKNHGIVNIDVALISAILSHQNTFVKEEINTPIANLGSLLQAALDSDNLEMMRLLATRFEKSGPLKLRTNRTSFWYIYFGRLDESYTSHVTGFGRVSGRGSGFAMFEAMLSDLTRPLPFSYEQVKHYVDLDFTNRFVSALWEGITTNYARLEWIVDTLIQKASDNLLEIRTFQDWIRTFLPLVGNPMARGVMERCKRLLGTRWRVFTDPITSPVRLQTVLSYMLPTGNDDVKFIPAQPEALEAWLDECLNGRFVGEVRVTDDDGDQFFRGLLFILYYYPGGEFTRDPNPVRARTFTKVDGSPFDFHGTLLRFFEKKPIPVIHRILEYRLLDVWDEIVKSDRLQLRPLDTLDGLGDLMPLIKGAALGGANELFENLRQMYTNSLKQMKEPAEVLEPYEQALRRIFFKTGRFPRLELASTGSTEIKVRSPRRGNDERIRLANEKLAENEDFIAERLRFLPR
jgi:hypothetical protein